MREYQFYAGEPHDEMIMGICFPAALMLPTSILGAVMWYFIPDYHPLSKSLTGFGWVGILGVIIGFSIMSLVKRYCIRKYTVRVSEKTILIDAVGGRKYQGEVHSVTLNQNKMKTVLEINLDHQKLIFIARVKKNVFESSIFAGSTKEDIQTMTTLYQALQEVLY
jgi:hypothetical protein